MKNWYIVQSHSSFENKVAGLIKEEAEKAKISEKFEEIIVPTHDITEVKRGKRVQRKKKYFPGYVLIKSEMDNNIYHMIKNIKRVSGFLGSKGIPVPVSDKEVENSIKTQLEGELQQHALKHGKNSVELFNKFDSSEKGVSRQNKAQITFPPSITEKFLRRFDNSTIMVTQNAPVYLASVLEYLCMEILEQSINNAREQKRVRLTVKDIELSIRNDVEINRLFTRNNIMFLGGSNIPHINPVLLHRKTTSKRKTGNPASKKAHRFKPGTVSLREIRKLQKTLQCITNSESIDTSKLGDAQNLKDKEIFDFLGDD